MDELIIEGVRCFAERQQVPLRPITLLVGENSTGKTTFLALTRLACHVASGRLPINFNDEPFLLGAFDDIASYRGGSGGRAESFTIGARVSTTWGPPEDEKGHVPPAATITARFVGARGQPQMNCWLLDASGYRLEVLRPEEETHWRGTLTTPSSTTPLTLQRQGGASPADLLLLLGVYGTQLSAVGEKAPPHEENRVLHSLIPRLMYSLHLIPYAFAPIRTRPDRTYNPIQVTPKPEGGHVPMVLAWVASAEPTAWKELRASLVAFGKASGLFREVRVQEMGRRQAGPFQLRLKVSGPAFNLVDVGYGVSQVLPIIVDAIRGEEGRTFLLQQPEVHLHPKAQAELSSFLALLAKTQNKRFVIETHSDYIVDRIRMEVRDGKAIGPDDVALLYFERTKGSVKIHRLRLDEMGNIVDAPKGYGAFFLTEARRLLQG